MSKKKARKNRAENGAGEGNRTLIISLGSWSSTTELHPQKAGKSGLKIIKQIRGR